MRPAISVQNVTKTYASGAAAVRALDGVNFEVGGGEIVLASPGAPGTPIITAADNSALRVRADVDETDVGKLRVGQRAFMTAEAYGDRKFYGRVLRVGEVLGRNNVRTDEPAEKVDTKILETLVELEPGGDLKLGLRVDAFIVCDVCGRTPRE
jgi:hypothetical protein